MAIKQKYISLDKYFHSIKNRKLILNEYSIFDFNHSKEFYNSMITEFEGDQISLLPRCSCGHLKSEYYKGVTCTKCNTKVSDLNYDPVVWAKSFNTNELPFLNPMFYYILDVLLQRDIKYLTGVTPSPRTKSNVCIQVARDVLHGERTYANFIINIRNILTYLQGLSSYKNGKRALNIIKLLEIWDTKKPLLLSEYIPLVNNVLFNVTVTNNGKFTDVGLADVFDVASSWMRVANNPVANKIDHDKCTAKAVTTLGSMPEFYIKTYLSGKSGIFRKHCYGARSPFTFRCVITSKTGVHRHDDVEVPWASGLSVFRPHVLNKLVKRGYSYKNASKLIYSSVKRYNPEIDEILQELIKETPNGRGIPITLHRNPTLLPGSSQLVYITKFKTDPWDFTIGMSVLICKAPNADYDGDELNVIVHLDGKMHDMFNNFSPYYNVPGDTPYSISGNLSLLPPANSILLEYLSSKHDHPEQDTVLKKIIS